MVLLCCRTPQIFFHVSMLFLFFHKKLHLKVKLFCLFTFLFQTQSELIRLDEASAISETRGRSSELYKWLSQQAKMGSLEAKVFIHY